MPWSAHCLFVIQLSSVFMQAPCSLYRDILLSFTKPGDGLRWANAALLCSPRYRNNAIDLVLLARGVMVDGIPTWFPYYRGV